MNWKSCLTQDPSILHHSVAYIVLPSSGSPDTVVDRLVPREPLLWISFPPDVDPRFSHHSVTEVSLASHWKVTSVSVNVELGAGDVIHGG